MGRGGKDPLVVLRQTIRLSLPKGPFHQVRGLASGNLQVKTIEPSVIIKNIKTILIHSFEVVGGAGTLRGKATTKFWRTTVQELIPGFCQYHYQAAFCCPNDLSIEGMLRCQGVSFQTAFTAADQVTRQLLQTIAESSRQPTSGALTNRSSH